MNKNEDLIILFSGGADSVLLLELSLKLGRIPYCIIVDYGQVHRIEINYAEKYLKDKQIPYHIVKIENLNINSGLTGNLKLAQYSGVSEFNIPGRNTIFLSLAFGIAESMNIKEIWYGPDFSDCENLFPDTYQNYVCKVNELFKIAGSYPIKIYAPLLGFTKKMVIDYLENICDINMNFIFSGYGDLEEKK